MPKATIKVTKLALILQERGMKQTEFKELILSITDKKGKPYIDDIGKDFISHLVTGKKKSYALKTAKLLSLALNLPIDEIVEDDILETA